MPAITTDNLRVHLSINGAQHGAAITAATNAANEAVALWCGRSFETVDVSDETARVFYPDSQRLAIVDDFHDTTNLVVEVDGNDDGVYETAWAAADFQLEPLNGTTSGVATPWYRIFAVGSRSFPTCTRRPTVQVTAAWGWAVVPAAVHQAALIKAARLFHRKDSPQGVAGFDQFGVVRLSSREDADVMMLLAPFRRSEQILMVG